MPIPPPTRSCWPWRGAGHRDALEALFERVARRLDDVAGRLVSRSHDPLDVVQEACLSLLRKLPWLTVRTSFDGLLYGEARNAARAVRAAHPSSTDLQGVPEPSCEDRWPCLREDLTAVLANVPPLQREVLVLHYLHGIVLQKIAERIRAPIGTVRSRLQRGLDHARADPRVRSHLLP